MTERKRFEGKDLNDALRSASAALGIPIDRLAYELDGNARRGMFGIGARVRIWAEPNPDEPARARPTALERAFARAEGSSEDAEWVGALVEELLTLMSFDLNVAARPEAGGIRAELAGADRDRMLAGDGELLDALQFLVNRIASKHRRSAGRVRLECEGFRQERDRDLIELAQATARKVAASGESRWLPALNPYERRLVHVTVDQIPGVTTVSAGDGFLKRIRITPAKPPAEA